MSKMCNFDGCERSSRRWGLCSKHATRQYRNGDPSVITRAPNGEPTRWLNEHVLFDGVECLAWPFHIASNGRARLDVGRKQKNAAMVMCELVHGPAPSPKHQAAHSCGKGHTGCVHPKHLSWKTPTENQADRLIHGTLYPERPRHNTSGAAGVGWHKARAKWRAYISENNKQKSLGFFDRFEDAVEARQTYLANKIGEIAA